MLERKGPEVHGDPVLGGPFLQVGLSHSGREFLFQKFDSDSVYVNTEACFFSSLFLGFCSQLISNRFANLILVV